MMFIFRPCLACRRAWRCSRRAVGDRAGAGVDAGAGVATEVISMRLVPPAGRAVRGHALKGTLRHPPSPEGALLRRSTPPEHLARTNTTEPHDSLLRSPHCRRRRRRRALLLRATGKTDKPIKYYTAAHRRNGGLFTSGKPWMGHSWQLHLTNEWLIPAVLAQSHHHRDTTK